jgi:hypothetical protein
MGGMDDELEPQTEPEEIPFAFPASQATTPAVMHVDPSLIDTKYLHVRAEFRKRFYTPRLLVRLRAPAREVGSSSE